MVFPDVSPYENSRIPKSLGRCKLSSFVSDVVMFFGGALVALLLVWSLWSFANSNPSAAPNFSKATTPSYGATSLDNAASAGGFDLRHDQPELTFYDDPKMSYSVENPVKNWDEKRRRWLEHHRSFTNGASERVLLVTGSQPSPCRNPDGDHLLLRFFKNKVDYCRRHGYEIFYNNVLLNPKMFTFWAKYPVVRAAMVAHPEAEWIWWVDSDAAITDMDFKLPLKRYKDHNLVVHGWADMIYEKKSWTGLNAGVFLIRNCQWSMDFLDKWASMGPQSPDYDKWGEIQRSIFRDKLFPESDDQTALAYLILTERERWADKIYTEGEYYFEGYWHEIVGTLDHINDRYVQIEKRARRLRRRHAEKVSESYSQMMEPYLKGAGNGRGSWRRPFITHFTGCQPCSGKYNQLYSGDSCSEGMQKALNFADNQVLRNFGYIHPDIRNSSIVTPLPFDFPS